MGLEPDFLTLVNDTLVVEPCTGFSGDGEPIYGPATSAPVVVQCERRQVFQKDGKVEISTTQLYVLSTSLHVGMQDRLSWSTMLPGSTSPPRIVNVDHTEDEDGQHHVEIMLG